MWALVLIQDNYVDDWLKGKIIKAEDPEFFNKLERMLIEEHDKVACAKYCKELLGAEEKPKRR